jgi:hypothetical protein
MYVKNMQIFCVLITDPLSILDYTSIVSYGRIYD